MHWTNDVKERPILFKPELVRKIIAGEKTQTRRICKKQPSGYHYLQAMYGSSPDGHPFGERGLWREVGPDYPDGEDDDLWCPYGAPGDRLWVREAWAPIEADLSSGKQWAGYIYRARYESASPEGRRAWRPSIHMPRDACRLVLAVTNVRVERLQEITEQSALAEGMPDTRGAWEGLGGSGGRGGPREAFRNSWDAINGKRATWASNPWVWVVSFRRLEEPGDD